MKLYPDQWTISLLQGQGFPHGIRWKENEEETPDLVVINKMDYEMLPKLKMWLRQEGFINKKKLKESDDKELLRSQGRLLEGLTKSPGNVGSYNQS